jgi:hypothetical protein
VAIAAMLEGKMFMTKAKKRATVRKKTSKRGKAGVKPARKMAAKRMRPKKTKSRVRRTSKIATNRPRREKCC